MRRAPMCMVRPSAALLPPCCHPVAAAAQAVRTCGRGKRRADACRPLLPHAAGEYTPLQARDILVKDIDELKV